MVNVLNEGLHLLLNVPLSHRRTTCANAAQLVERQRFAQHFDERAIARQKDCVAARVCAASGGDVESDKRFAGAWDPRHKDDRLVTQVLRLLDY